MTIKSKYKLLTIGSDPEVPIFDTLKNKFVRAGRYIPGSKHDPFLIGDEGHSIQSDNVNAEFTIPPCTTPKQMHDHINFCLGKIAEKLPEEVIIKVQASAHYDAEELDDPQSNEFYCDPDQNAWNLEVNTPPHPETTLRSAGGHIHLGVERWDEKDMTFDDFVQLVRMCDLFLGVPSVLYDNSPESIERKQLYGRAGSFRIKPYGIEYRSLSNFFVGNRRCINWIFESVKAGLKFLDTHEITPDNFGTIEQIINNGNSYQKTAKQLMKKYNIPVLKTAKVQEIAEAA